MLTGPNVILALKVAVGLATLVFLASLVALARGKQQLHGRINIVFFVLTLVALFAFELIIRVIRPEVFAYIETNPDLNRSLLIHLCFSIPAALLMPAMLFTGLKRYRRAHLTLAVLFGILWLGTIVTGIFFLPHS